jgi:hypothetical protein
MKTRKRKDDGPKIRPKTIDEAGVVTEVEPAPEPAPTPTARIAIPIKESGAIDFDMMRESTKQKLRDAIASTPELRPTEPTAQQIQIFHPAMISGMYDMLGAIESAGAQRFWKIPEPVAKQVFTYSPTEKDALSGPTIRVLNKYAAEWMIKYQDEIALATLLTSLTISKVNGAIIAARLYRERATTTEASSQAENDKEAKKETVKPQVQ